MIVAIDGPAGAGKSTVARAVARRLGVGHLDTGAMYRALTWLALERGVDPAAGDELVVLARANPAVLEPAAEGGRVWIAAEDATEAIRRPEVTARVSEVSAHLGVREAMVAAQRALLREGDWVCEGRDIGTVVAPDAAVKVFLTASPEERARRRAVQIGADVQTVLAEQTIRDERDTTRAHSPLEAAPDAVELDTTGLTLDDVIARVAALVEQAR